MSATIYLVVFLFLVHCTSVARTTERRDTLRASSGRSLKAAYMSTDIIRHVQRFQPPVGARITGFIVELAGGVADTAALVSLYGNEGGTAAPHLRQPLGKKLLLRKSVSGVVKMAVDLDVPVVSTGLQLFLSIEGLAKSIRPVTDTEEQIPYCIEATGLERYNQLLGHADGSWESSPYAFCVSLIYERSEKSPSFQFSLDTLLLATTRKDLAASSNITCDDLDGNGLPDIGAAGFVYLNRGKSFDVIQLDSAFRYAPYVFHDIDADQKLELIILPDPLRNDVRVFRLSSNNKLIQDETFAADDFNRVSSICRLDTDGDGTPELFLSGTRKTGRPVLGIIRSRSVSRPARLEFLPWLDALPDGGATLAPFITNEGSLPTLLVRSVTGSVYGITIGDEWGSNPLTLISDVGTSVGLGGLFVASNSETQSAVNTRSIYVPSTTGHVVDSGASIKMMKHGVTPIGEVVALADPKFEIEMTGMVVADLNNDGWDDIVVTQGAPCHFPRVLLGSADGYHESTEPSILDTLDGVLDLAAADVDRDGKVDLIVVCEGRLHLLRNTTSNTGITIKPSAKGSSILGTEVTVFSQGVQSRTRIVSSGRGHNIVEEPTAHFGLAGLRIDSINVRWPSPLSGRSTIRGPFVESGFLDLESSQLIVRTHAIQLIEQTDAVISVRVETQQPDVKNARVYVTSLEGMIIQELFRGVPDETSSIYRWTLTQVNGVPVPTGVYVIVSEVDGNVESIACKVVR